MYGGGLGTGWHGMLGSLPGVCSIGEDACLKHKGSWGQAPGPLDGAARDSGSEARTASLRRQDLR